MFPQHLFPEKNLILGVLWGGLFSRQPPSGRLLFLAIKARAWIVSSVRRLILGSGTGVFEIAVAARDVDLVFYRPAVMARNSVGLPIKSLATVHDTGQQLAAY
jgi:hypothetical protein